MERIGRHPLWKRAKEWAVWQKTRELSDFLWLVEELRPSSVLEIGTHAGGTLYCWCRLASPDATLVSVDLPGADYGGGYTPERGEEMKLLFPQNGQALHLIQGDSHAPETLDEVRSRVQSLDFLFIDGDHSYGGVKRDYEMYGPLVRSGGLIAFHDICERAIENFNVYDFWRDVREGRDYEEIISPPETWGGIGILHV